MGGLSAFASVMDPSLLCEVLICIHCTSQLFVQQMLQYWTLWHFQVMFDDNGGSGAAPLDNLTEDDIVLLDGDYDEVGELVHE